MIQDCYNWFKYKNYLLVVESLFSLKRHLLTSESDFGANLHHPAIAWIKNVRVDLDTLSAEQAVI